MSIRVVASGEAIKCQYPFLKYYSWCPVNYLVLQSGIHEDLTIDVMVSY